MQRNAIEELRNDIRKQKLLKRIIARQNKKETQRVFNRWSQTVLILGFLKSPCTKSQSFVSGFTIGSSVNLQKGVSIN